MDPDDRYFRVPAKRVCAAHTEDAAVRRFIEGEASEAGCDYCDVGGDEPLAVWLVDLVDFIAEGVGYEWAHADDVGVPYDTSEGGYQLVTPLTSLELLDGATDLAPTHDANVVADIAAGLGGDAWVPRHFFELSASERLAFGWESFSAAVKHSSRFFFEDLGSPDEADRATPTELLDLIGRTAEACGFVTTAVAGRKLFRARTHHRADVPDDARRLGAPPVAAAISANRMSPAGVSMFYGAWDPDTALAEARAAEPSALPAATIGTFEILRPLLILDLSETPEVPSPFDREARDRRPPLMFLHAFVRELRQPIQRDRSEHVEYVPTQVVCDFLRTRFRCRDGRPLDGISYASNRHPTGVNVVLFLDNDGARDLAGSVGARRREEGARQHPLQLWRPGAATLELKEVRHV